MSRAERRRRMPAFGWLLVVVFGLLLAIFVPRGLYDAYAAGHGGGAAQSRYEEASFTIAGTITKPLWVGDQVPVDLTFTNPHGYPVSAEHIRVQVRSVQAPNADAAHPCSSDDFTIRQIADGVSITIPSRQRTSLDTIGLAQTSWPMIGLVNLPTNQDGCQGASVILAYTAEGSPR